MTYRKRSFSHRVETTFPKRVCAKSPLALRLLVPPMCVGECMHRFTNVGSRSDRGLLSWPAVLGLSALVLTCSVTVFLIKRFAYGPYVE